MRSRNLRILIVALVVVGFSMGMLALAKKPVPGPCPSPKPGWSCPMYYAPVVCGPDDCWYSNDCFAGLAGWNDSECTSVGPGPVPLPF